MTESNNTGDKTISVAPRKPLTLKRSGVERDTVRQSFSHGRTNTVQVERKKRRVTLPSDAKSATPAPVSPPVRPVAEAPKVVPQPEDTTAANAAAAARAGLVLRELSDDELDARARALADAKVHEAEERKIAEEAAARRAEENARLALEREEAERRQSEEDVRRRTDESLREKAEDAARRRFGEEEKKAAAERGDAAQPADAKAKKEVVAEDDDRPGIARGRVKTSRPADPKPVKRDTEDRRRGRLTLVNALDDTVRERSLASIRRRRERERARAHEGPREKIMREVIVPETISVQELANRMSERAVDVIKLLMKQDLLHQDR